MNNVSSVILLIEINFISTLKEYEEVNTQYLLIIDFLSFSSFRLSHLVSFFYINTS